MQKQNLFNILFITLIKFSMLKLSQNIKRIIKFITILLILIKTNINKQGHFVQNLKPDMFFCASISLGCHFWSVEMSQKVCRRSAFLLNFQNISYVFSQNGRKVVTDVLTQYWTLSIQFYKSRAGAAWQSSADRKHPRLQLRMSRSNHTNEDLYLF